MTNPLFHRPATRANLTGFSGRAACADRSQWSPGPPMAGRPIFFKPSSGLEWVNRLSQAGQGGMSVIELRDLDEARRFVLQGLWLQKVIVPPSAGNLRTFLEWALEIASSGDP